jgi:hypothetical protein
MWPSTIAEQLRQRGHDVVAVLERDDLQGESDAVILATATSERRVVVTENVGDFRVAARAAHERGEFHFGMILTTNRGFSRHHPRSIGRMVTALNTLLETDPDLTNQEHWLR